MSNDLRENVLMNKLTYDVETVINLILQIVWCVCGFTKPLATPEAEIPCCPSVSPESDVRICSPHVADLSIRIYLHAVPITTKP